MTGTQAQPDSRVFDKRDLPHSEIAHGFEGRLHGDANVSSFLIDASQGAVRGFTPIPTKRFS